LITTGKAHDMWLASSGRDICNFLKLVNKHVIELNLFYSNLSPRVLLSCDRIL